MMTRRSVCMAFVPAGLPPEPTSRIASGLYKGYPGVGLPTLGKAHRQQVHLAPVYLSAEAQVKGVKECAAIRQLLEPPECLQSLELHLR